jgi:hypothetical protein
MLYAYSVSYHNIRLPFIVKKKKCKMHQSKMSIVNKNVFLKIKIYSNDTNEYKPCVSDEKYYLFG